MKELNLLAALNDLDEDLLLEAITAPRRRRFRPATALIAAALAGTLVMSVGAAVSGSGWFQTYFAKQSQQPLTPPQVAQVQASTQDLGQSLTLEGYTMTLESAIADPWNCYLKLTITGPQGTVMDNHQGYGMYNVPSPEDLYHVFAPVSGAEFSGVGVWENQPDDNPEDNQVSILYRYNLNRDSGVNFETDPLWRLTVRNLTAWGDRVEEDRLLAQGDFCFDITFDKLSPGEKIFIYQPLAYTFRSMGGGAPVEGAITSCVLRPMGGELTISGCAEAVGFNKLPVVMKDGTQVDLCSGTWGNGSYSYFLRAPIDLEEVDHILLPDGTKLYNRVG